MRVIRFLLLALLTACGSTGEPFDTPYAAGVAMDDAEQCVPYARRMSGMQLFGDAYTWWNQAPPEKRGALPRPGAVLVLANTAKLSRGHLAVVKRMVDARHIDVAHSNWGWDSDSRRIAYSRMRVMDTSEFNDWSLLRFWNKDVGDYGFPYPALGFIYP